MTSTRPILDFISRTFAAITEFRLPDAEFWLDLLEMALNFGVGVLFLYCVMAVLFGPLFLAGIYGWTQEERDKCRAYNRRYWQ